MQRHCVMIDDVTCRMTAQVSMRTGAALRYNISRNCCSMHYESTLNPAPCRLLGLSSILVKLGIFVFKQRAPGNLVTPKRRGCAGSNQVSIHVTFTLLLIITILRIVWDLGGEAQLHIARRWICMIHAPLRSAYRHVDGNIYTLAGIRTSASQSC